MQRPTGASEQARYSTVQIVTVETDGNQYTGTGFLFHFESKDAICPAIIANRHVIADAKSVTFAYTWPKSRAGSVGHLAQLTLLPWQGASWINGRSSILAALTFAPFPLLLLFRCSRLKIRLGTTSQ